LPAIVTEHFPKTRRRLGRSWDGFDQITVSFTGVERAGCEITMGGLDFRRAQKRLEKVVKTAGGIQTTVAVNVTVTRQIQPHLPAIRKYPEGI
jgi:MoaA/NifB/PqqE/SkfB family radical SAM enzyme